MGGQAVDYSTGYPGAQVIRDHGFKGAVRYIGFPDRRKCTNAEEVRDFQVAGVGMALVIEDDIGDWRRGFAGGQHLASLGLRHAGDVGFPAERPFYMAVDSDVQSGENFRIMGEYLQGAGSVLGGAELVGVYGEADVLDYARAHGLAEWFWQTTAWSRGRRVDAHLYQRMGYVRIGKVTCDFNDILKDDWGQAFDGSADMLTPQEIDAIADRVIAKIKTDFWAGEWRDGNGRNPMDVAAETLHRAINAASDAEAAVQAALRLETALATLLARPAVTVDATAVATELQRLGVQGATPRQVRDILMNVRLDIGEPPAASPFG
jgi:hypothetical protein